MVWRYMRFAELAVALIFGMAVSSCASAGGLSPGGGTPHAILARPVAGVRAGLVPVLDGGKAGWCLALTDPGGPERNGGAVCTGARPSSGPIFVEVCSGGVSGAEVVVLTRRD